MQAHISLLTVSQLNRQIRTWLETEIPVVHVEGELSNVSKPASGHYYFTLKDSGAQIRCVYFRSRHTNLCALLSNGQQVVAQGKLSLYEARGDYQLIVEQLTEAGLGDLYRQFEVLKNKLQALGLFETSRKKSLPRFPEHIGIITSATGAALQDILTTLARRYPIAEITVYASEVQGKTAEKQLIKALEQANQDRRCDVLILARGGGSMEDLWAFNHEALAFSIAESTIPIVSGIGHETDFTIADFVADWRAATPTAAAEAVSPNCLDLLSYFQGMQTRLLIAMKRLFLHQQNHLKYTAQKLTSPKPLLIHRWQTLDYLQSQLHRCLEQGLQLYYHRLHLLLARLNAQNPHTGVKRIQERLGHVQQQLVQVMQVKLNNLSHRLQHHQASLHAMSPLATLDRGYAIVTHGDCVLMDTQSVLINDKINIRLAKGGLIGTVTGKKEA